MFPAQHIPSMAAEPPLIAPFNTRGFAQCRRLDPDAAAVYKAFRRPAARLRNGTPAEARELYLAARVVSNPEPPELESVKPLDPRPARRDPGAHLHAEDAAQDNGWRRAWCSSTAAAG
jgi:hypothetical protein